MNPIELSSEQTWSYVPPMINGKLAAFLHGPAMLIVASRDAGFRPAIARSLGARCGHEGMRVALFISRAQWPDAVANLAPEAPIALTASDPASYRTYQIKGIVDERIPANAEDHAAAERYKTAMTSMLTRLGVMPHQIACWLTLEDLVRIGFRPHAVFEQTPGRAAGARLPSGTS